MKPHKTNKTQNPKHKNNFKRENSITHKSKHKHIYVKKHINNERRIIIKHEYVNINKK